MGKKELVISGNRDLIAILQILRVIDGEVSDFSMGYTAQFVRYFDSIKQNLDNRVGKLYLDVDNFEQCGFI